MFPGENRFAFTIFDDTDHATVANVKPVYDLLHECGFRTTKSVWVYPPRGTFTGGCLLDPGYLAFVRELVERGFEIGLHNVGDGRFTSDEVLRGFEIFRNVLGAYPTIHANHYANPGNLYWWGSRFEWPLSFVYEMLIGSQARGEDPTSDVFWGDISKRHIKYIRNLTFNDPDTLNCDPKMPYRVRRKSEYSNLWFSSSDGHTVREFTDLIAPDRIDRVEAAGGAMIVYTHLAMGFVRDGRVEPEFEARIRSLAARKGWFVPATTLLDHLAARNGTTVDPGRLYHLGLNLRWLRDRLAKRRRQITRRTR